MNLETKKLEFYWKFVLCSHLKPIQITKLRLEMDCSSKKVKQKEKKLYLIVLILEILTSM